ncbi:protein phosphatase methylesterase 1 [Trypanosoma conorhini]|uniref:Protein phosphatase methylesterase 1 n=1 Tax=Trypanosoma conorhini TaxID=83891 RepID=A0A422NEX5_9TRYP|nr:protein phosphatase methylesterase 1 [Trypanosoma conorhini]RNF04032.1 protein phosphatase methylesterase 1 [Trypanosoma conorhini]
MDSHAVAPHEDHEIVLPSGDKFHVVVFGGIDEEYTRRGETPPPLLFCVHGAGMSCASYFLLSTHLMHPQYAEKGGVELNPKESADIVRVVAYDMRCHGDSTFNGGEGSLTLQLLMDDFFAVIRTVKSTLFPDTPRLYVVGHSLGGSVAMNALSRFKELMNMVAGVVLLDVVEGTARMSLRHMDKFLQNRPQQFSDVAEAQRWFLQSGGMTTASGAAVTVPPLLKRVGDHYEWKSNLEAMAPVWSGWFNGLDDAFVGLPCPKILCLANAERLDDALTVAQMQGKFQFEVLGGGCGHYVMDDQPAALASKLRRFIKRIETMSEKLRFNLRKEIVAS